MTSASLAAKALWRRGILDWKLHAGQLKIREALKRSRGKLFVGNCARQFGKSTMMIAECLELAIQKPNARIKYGTAYLSDLEEFVLPNFDMLLSDCPSSVKPTYKSQKKKWVFPNGSEIKLVGLDKNPNGLRGNTIDLIVLDECGFISNLDYLYKSIIVPATTHRPNAKIIMISTPPSTPAHSFRDYAERAHAEGNYVILTVFDNPMLTPEAIEHLKKESGGEDSTTWQREYLCLFVTDEDAKVIREWSSKHVVARERDEFFQFYHLYSAMDMGRRHKTALLFGYYDFRRATLVIEDELEMKGTVWTTVTLKDDILKKEKELWPTRIPKDEKQPKIYRRIADNNNPHLIQDLNGLYGVHFLETNKDSLEAMVNEVRIMAKDGRLEVHPRCTMLIGCLDYGVWDKQRKKFAESKVYGHYDHLAALIYLVRNLDKYTNPVPPTFGLDVRNAVIKNNRQLSEGAKLFGNLLHKPTKKPTY
jgi:hypothetical protein